MKTQQLFSYEFIIVSVQVNIRSVQLDCQPASSAFFPHQININHQSSVLFSNNV